MQTQENKMNVNIEIEYQGVSVGLSVDGDNPAVIKQTIIGSIDKLWDKPSEQSRVMFLNQAIDQTHLDRWSRNEDVRGTMKRMERNFEILGNMPVEFIDTKVVKLLRNYLENNNIGTSEEPTYWSPATVDLHLGCLKTVLNNCKQRGYLKELPEIITTGKEKQSIRIIQPSEKQELLAYILNNKSNIINGLDLAPQVELLFETGMSLEESSNITYGRNIHFERRRILLTADITQSRIPRVIPMTDKAYAILKQRNNDGSQGRPFPWNKDLVISVWNKIKKAIGADDPEFLPSAIQDTVAVGLIRNGMSITKVQIFLGHQDYSRSEIWTYMVADDWVDDLEKWSWQNN